MKKSNKKQRSNRLTSIWVDKKIKDKLKIYTTEYNFKTMSKALDYVLSKDIKIKEQNLEKVTK